MMRGNQMIYSSVLAKKDLVDQVGGFDKTVNEDYALWKKIYQLTDGIYLNEPLTHYLDMGDSWRHKIDLNDA